MRDLGSRLAETIGEDEPSSPEIREARRLMIEAENLLSQVDYEAIVQVRRRWRSRFRARVKAMENLMARAADDNIPTPRTDGDD